MEGTTGTVFIVFDAHISENLQHHKASDVQRVLEEKGFEKSAAGDGNTSEYHFRNPGNPGNGKRTRVRFDDQDFVIGEGGVEHYEE